MKEDKRGGRKPAPVPTGHDQRATTVPRTATGKTMPSRRARRTRRTASPATGDKNSRLNGIVCFFLRMAQTERASMIGGHFQQAPAPVENF